MVCDDAPPVPDPVKASQKDVAVFLPGLYGAWQNCSGNLAAVKEFVMKAKAQVTP